VPGGAIEWAADGSFTVFGRTGHDALRVLLSPGPTSPFLPALEFRRGAVGLEFARTPPGELALDVWAADAPLKLTYAVIPSLGGPAIALEVACMVRPVPFGETGVHVIPLLGPLPPGRYRVRVRDADGALRLTLDDVTVEPGQRARPMLGAPLELRR
jgi:hypothetical protein